MPKISVIVPVYKAEAYLHRCVDSILTQTFQNFEILLIDDGSPDNSGVICDEYAKKDSRIKVFHTKNKGVSHARNLGIINAQGEWIIYIDSDDYFLPKAFHILYTTADKYKLKVCTGNHYIEKDERRKVACLGRKEQTLKNNYRSYFFNIISPRAGSTIFHKSVLKNNLFDENLNRYEDLKSLLDIMRLHTFVYVPNCIMCYNIDQVGLSKKCTDIKKDFLFSLDFRNKSLWERLILADLVNKQKELYLEHKKELYFIYKKEWNIVCMARMLNIIRKIFFKFNKYVLDR